MLNASAVSVLKGSVGTPSGEARSSTSLPVQWGVRSAVTQLPLFGDTETATAVDPDRFPRFSVRESARAKRLSIKVHPRGRVEVVVPRRTRPAEVEAFVAESRGWILESLASFDAASLDADTRPPVRIHLPAIGREFVVRYRSVRSATSVRCRELGSTLVLSGKIDDAAACRAALRRWLARLARREFEPRLLRLSCELGLPVRKVQIRAQRTCWGSHSSSGTVSLNLCLLFVTPEVLRYLMVHELCHARHMNHSRAFWRLVGRYEPRYRRLDRALGEAWRDVPAWLEIT